MRFLHRIRFALRAILNRRTFESELNEELAHFVEQDAENRVKRGQSREAAEHEALVDLRGAQQAKERVRELYPGVWFETLWHDIRFAARALRKRPGYLMLAIATMALGIGANTAIFSLLHAVLLQPLPFKDPERLVLLQTQMPDGLIPQVAFLDFVDVRNQHPGIEKATLFLYEAFVVERQISSGERRPMRHFGLRVTPEFFATLGVHPAVGRGFAAKESVTGNDRVVVLSHRFWTETLGQDANALGTQILINEQPHTVIGIMPAAFEVFLPMSDSFTIQDTDIYIQLLDPSEYVIHRSIFTLEAIARLRKNVPHEKAQSDMLQISRQLAREYPDTNSRRLLLMTQLQEHVVGGIRPALLLLMAAVVTVLLVACANLANLTIGRVAAREQEVAVCAALGASRARLVRRLLAENMLMVAMGGSAGIVLAAVLLPQMSHRFASGIAGSAAIHLNPAALLFAILACLLTGVVSGLFPAAPLWSRTASASLHQTGRAMAGGSRARMRKSLVVAEMALSCVLLVGAILLGSSFLSLTQVETGFDSASLLTFQVKLSESRYETRKQVARTMTEFTQRLEAMPAIERVTVSSSLPLSGHNTGTSVWIEGRMPVADRQPPAARWQFVQPGYFETMRIGLKSGRYFEPQDLERKTHVTLISESVARRDFPNENPLGKKVSYGPPGRETDWHEIIGVVGDVRHGTLREDPVPRVYDLLGQHADLNLFVVARTRGDASHVLPSIRAILSQVDPGAPVYDVRTMEQWKTRSVNREQTLAMIVALFAAAALFLGAVGAYGVISSLVAQRTREIGIRMALGAAPQTILHSTILEGVQLAITGLAVGLLLSLSLAPLLRGILFGVQSTDLRAFASVISMLLIVAFAASWIPARRAARIDPIRALRQE